MDFHDTPEEASFRQEVRTFLKQELPERFRGMGAGMYGGGGRGNMRARFEELKEWRQRLSGKGWIAPAWRTEYGGAGLSVMQQFVMNEEFAEARAPQVGGFGTSMIGPTLIIHGSEDQKKEHLGRILSGDVQWCQGFSESGSGSDLASLQTKAVRDGDDYVINGSKIWTSGAQYAHWMFMLARTDADAPKHKGISYFLLDMKSPGVTVRPLVNMANQGGFNEVFFDNVRVPRSGLLGELNRGWYMATTTLDLERSSVAGSAGSLRTLEELTAFAGETRANGKLLLELPLVRHKLADLWIELKIARFLSYRVVTLQERGLVPNHEASMIKVFNSEYSQRLARAGLHILGLYGQLRPESAYARLRGRFERSYLTSAGITIAAGTSEIQRNIIAQRGLGLPR